jgi:UDP-glucose:(heptosyl)LPS alpha-1,3-glucosyltransferase
MREIALLKTHVFTQGGLEKYALRIARGFLDGGERVSLLTSGVAPDLPGVSIHSTKTCPWPAFFRMEQYDRFVQKSLKQKKYDLVFGMDRNRTQTHYRAGNGVHKAFLKSRIQSEGKLKWLKCLCNPLHLKILELERAAFEYPGLIKLFANSHMVKEEIQNYYRVTAHIEVIQNGVEWHEMEGDFVKWKEKRESITKNPSCFHFLFIGNGYLRKGLGQLLLGLRELKTRDFHLSVIGKDNRWTEFQALAEKYQLKNHVTFFGHQKDIRPFYQLADALVIPSFYDPFANVTVEALAMGLFVVSSKSNGGHEILTSENGCVIEDLTDPASIREALSCALLHPKTLESSFAIRKAVRHLDFSLQIPRLIQAC